MRRPVLLAAAVLTAVAASGCSSGVTAQRLAAAVGPTFARLYAVQHQQLGTAVQRPPGDTASCVRGGPETPDRGAGDDWVCTVRYPFPDGHVEPIGYDVRVQPTGCYTADGPAAVVGQQRQRDPDGDEVTNPLYEFDGCFDPGLTG